MCATLIIHKSSTFQNVSYENNEKLSATSRGNRSDLHNNISLFQTQCLGVSFTRKGGMLDAVLAMISTFMRDIDNTEL